MAKKSILQEFKEFILSGNLLGSAFGIIIGLSFSKVVASLVKDVLMPLISLAKGGKDFSSLERVLKEGVPATKFEAGQEAIVMKYGQFFQTVLDFIIVAACIFLMMRVVNKLTGGKGLK